MKRERIREILLSHGFKIQSKQTDLKPYVYEAVEAVLQAERKASAYICHAVGHQYRMGRWADDDKTLAITSDCALAIMKRDET